MTKLLNYVTEFQEKGVLHEFDCTENHWADARKNAIELAEMLKSINEAPQNYSGIKVYLEYEQASEVFKHYIINGHSMQNSDILEALSKEYEILKSSNAEFEVMTGYSNGKNHYAVNQLYMKLCYFSR